jgi:long-chain acyl-CoA synthetase
LFTLDGDELAALADRGGTPTDRHAMVNDPRVLAVIQADVDAVNARFARIEQIKRFAVLDHDLSQAEGELTPTMKIKRATVAARYAALLESLYG